MGGAEEGEGQDVDTVQESAAGEDRFVAVPGDVAPQAIAPQALASRSVAGAIPGISVSGLAPWPVGKSASDVRDKTPTSSVS